MTELKLKTDVNRQFRNAEYYPQEPEPEPRPETFEIRAPWVEELLIQTRQSDDSELRAELEAQKQKQLVLEAHMKELAENQKIMQEQQAELLQNQTQTNEKMDTMLELLLKMQKPYDFISVSPALYMFLLGYISALTYTFDILVSGYFGLSSTSHLYTLTYVFL